MSWKIVRDNTEAVASAQGVSGRWRKSKTPISGLQRKLLEEAGEYMEQLDATELYDLLDVVYALIGLVDPDGDAAARHADKVAIMGTFSQCIEWTPVPENDKGLN